MTEELKTAIEKAKTYIMSDLERKEQLISWVYGNLAIENPSITKESIRKIVERT